MLTGICAISLHTCIYRNIYFVYIYIYIYIYIYTNFLSKVFGHPQKFLFLILKVLYLMKQIKHHNAFIYYAKYKSS